MKKGNLVYSTELGRTCPVCHRSLHQCSCRENRVLGDGRVRVQRETKGRAGKGVTLITGLPLASEALRELAGALKKRCGSGGTVRDGIVEIQGDHCDVVLKELLARGFAAKRSGG